MNSLKTTTITLLASIVTMTAIGFWTAPKLMAAVKAALVQNRDEPGRNPYQEGKTAECTYAGDCAFTSFSPVPAGMRLVITSVSGSFSTQGQSNQAYAVLGSQAVSRLVRHYLPATIQSLAPTTQTFVVNQSVLEYFEAGETPRIDIYTQTPYSSLQIFTLSGYYIALP